MCRRVITSYSQLSFQMHNFNAERIIIQGLIQLSSEYEMQPIQTSPATGHQVFLSIPMLLADLSICEGLESSKGIDNGQPPRRPLSTSTSPRSVRGRRKTDLHVRNINPTMCTLLSLGGNNLQSLCFTCFRTGDRACA